MRLALICALLCASPAAAQPGLEGSWREMLDADRRAGHLFLRHGLAKLLQALGPNDPELGDSAPWLLLDQALMRLERARRALPDDPDVAYLTAIALSRWERVGQDGALERRSEEAAEAWREVRRRFPDFHPDTVAFQLALLHTLHHDYPQARAEYSIALLHHVPEPVIPGYLTLPIERELMSLYWPVGRETVHGNLAEVSMLDGDLEEAVRQYEAALEASHDDPIAHALARWGLALALDRSGASEDAIRAATRVLRDDPIPPDHPIYGPVRQLHGLFAVLHIPGVFFEPAYEIHAYEALGHEALAREASSPARADEERADALRSWRLFLAEGGTESRFAEVARAHIVRLEPPPAPAPVRPRAGRSPRR